MENKRQKRKKEPKFNDYLGVPMSDELKGEIRFVGDMEDRDMASMARVLLKEAIETRKRQSRSGEATRPSA